MTARIRRTFRTELLAAVLCLSSLSAAPTSGLGLLVPAYFYPSWWDPAVNLWDDLADAAGQVPLVAIMNPNSGPGAGPNADYTREVDALRAAGGRVIGYVPTTYGARPIDQVLAEVDAYYAWYGLDGIYFDEVASAADPGLLAYYQACYDHLRSLDAAALVVLGQGTAADEPYVARSTQMIIHELDDGVSPFVQWQPDPYVSGHPADHFSVLAYNVADADGMRAAVDHAVANNAGWVYFTDDTAANPWDSLPTYWAEEVDKVSGGGLPELTSLAALTSTDLTYRRRTRTSPLVRVRVTNTSAVAISPPMVLVIESISEPSVTPTDASGFTSDGRPFYDLSDQIPGAELDPGERTDRLTMRFSNPSRRYFELETTVYRLNSGGGAAKVLLAAAGDEPRTDNGNTLTNYPNPFNATTQIAYEVLEDGEISLVVYDVLGQRVRVLTQGHHNRGRHVTTWDGRDARGAPVSSGLYLYHFASEKRSQSRWMLLLK